jgi:hypothetical protein
MRLHVRILLRPRPTTGPYPESIRRNFHLYKESRSLTLKWWGAASTTTVELQARENSSERFWRPSRILPTAYWRSFPGGTKVLTQHVAGTETELHDGNAARRFRWNLPWNGSGTLPFNLHYLYLFIAASNLFISLNELGIPSLTRSFSEIKSNSTCLAVTTVNKGH